MTPARYIMIGGFLGAGKTTAVLKIGHLLRQQNRRVGLITNDQSYGLVDTTMLQANGFPVREITGGCFCCRFNSLVEASEQLAAEAAPDVFIAEPVGSCTDLKATVDYPLRRLYGDNYAIAPLSVMVDPLRAMRILGLTAGPSFSQKVLYIYLKQLEEADIIVVNKIDLLPAEELARLQQSLQARFPATPVLAVSARHDVGIAEWVHHLLQDPDPAGPTMEVDYDLYAEGEARLAWLNGSARVEQTAAFDGNALLLDTAHAIRDRIRATGGEIAHLKMTLTPDTGNDIAVVNLVAADSQPELAHSLHEEMDSGEWIINVRAETDPATLRAAVEDVWDALRRDHALQVIVEHLECFRPARPVPTYRFTEV